MRQGDDQWFNLVKWVNFAMIDAEELGVTKANVDDKLKSDNPEIRRLLGVEGDYGKSMGVSKDWAYRIIKQVGNYGEVLRAQSRRGIAAEDQARPQCALEQGRHSICAADHLTFAPSPAAGERVGNGR